MDFIAQLLGIAPAGGAGTLEAVIVLVPGLLLAAHLLQHPRGGTRRSR